MFAQAENSRAMGRLIAANPFKDRAPIADNVGKNVNRGLVPVYEPAVVPYFLCGRHICHYASNGSKEGMK